MVKVSVVAIKHPTEPNLFLHGLRKDNGKWALAGGHAENGETDYEAACRELEEETGLSGVKLNKLANQRFGNNDVHLYCCDCPADFIPDASNDPDSEFTLFKWLDPTAHNNLHVPANRNILILWLNKKPLKKSLSEGPKYLVHYSSQKGLKQIDPEKMGTGVKGLQTKRGIPENKTSFFYTEDSEPESLVSDRASFKYKIKMPENIYDLSKDPQKIIQEVKAKNPGGPGAWNEDLFHSLLKQKGFNGVKWSISPKTHVVQLYHPQAVHEEQALKSQQNKFEDLEKGKKDILQMLGADSAKPEHVEFVNWASQLPNSNWQTWATKNYRQNPKQFTPEIKQKISDFSSSQHIPNIADVRFDKEHDLNSGIKLLDQAKQSYINKLSQNRELVIPTEKTKKIINGIKFNRDWFNLNVPSCEAEGKALGHCGNEDYHPDDRILSLRTSRSFDNKTFHEPHLSFILNNGFLGEMKGQSNLKPTKEYHKDIVELLKNPEIKGIFGGGFDDYELKNNFEFSDLSPEHQAEVLRHNPNLITDTKSLKNIKKIQNLQIPEKHINIISEIAENPKTDQDTLQHIYNTSKSWQKKLVAQNPNTHPDFLYDIYNKTDQDDIKQSVAKNPNIHKDFMRHIYTTTNDHNIKQSVASNTGADPFFLYDVYNKTNNDNIKQTIAENPALGENFIHNIADIAIKNNDINMQKKIAGNTGASKNTLNYLTRATDDFDIQLRLSQNSKTDSNDLDYLAKSKNGRNNNIQWAIAQNKNTNSHTLEYIYNTTNDTRIKQKVTENPNYIKRKKEKLAASEKNIELNLKKASYYFKNLLQKPENLNKGAARRLYGPFKPHSELTTDAAKNVERWTGGTSGETFAGYDPRAKIPDPSKHAKLRMTNKLAGRTESRINPNTKQREFLLHRQLSQSEMDKYHKNGKFFNQQTHSSWTPFLTNITESSGIYPKSSFDPEDSQSYNHIVSAWIPEDKIKSFLPQYGQFIEKQKVGPLSSRAAKEQEVIVRPGIDAEIHQIHKDTRRHSDQWEWQKIFGKSEDLQKNTTNIKNIADSYAKLNNIKLSHNYKVNLNPEHGKTIAQAYESMQHQPEHHETKAAYNALIGETGKQFKHLINSGLKISRMQPGQENPYKSSKDMLHDLHVNNHLWYYPTEQGFGSEGQSQNHPMLTQTEFKHDGTPLLANDVFRIVHDAFGHGLTNSQFGPKGEHMSYLAHKEMFSPLAQKALASETMGQNNWVNWSEKAGEHNRKNPSKTIYAEQKAGLLPENILETEWHK
jgi:8-oxo-dGTP pyrophosphatase MutT (NUDIX family)